jgi:hypothetical protein
MPDIVIPNWVNMVLLIGAISGAVTAVILLALRLGQGLHWVTRVHQSAILAPALEQIEILKQMVNELHHQMTSDNTGSLREQVNATRTELAEMRKEMKENQKWQYQEHAIIDEKLKKYGLAGPKSED